MNYANIKNLDIANGEGIRVSLFVSGCTHHCKNCFNPETWDFDYGKPFTEETEDEILKMLEPNHIAGITLLGGEPFDPRNQPALLNLVKRIKQKFGNNKNIWSFTGYIYDKDLIKGGRAYCEATDELLAHLDVLIDGPFVESLKNLMLKFRGSSNQRIINVPASLEKGEIILWEDWQGNGRGIK